MSELEVQSEGTGGLTQWQRAVNAFAAPSKTFADIRRGNKSWWLPLVLMAAASWILFAVVTQKIGMQQAVDNQIRMSARAQDQMAQATPEQRDRIERFWLDFTEGIFLGGPVVDMAYFAIVSGVMLGTINFIFGGRAKFGSVFAVFYYAMLPSVIKILLGIVVIYAGMAPESFNLKNIAPTNAGAFLDPVDTAPALYALASAIDAVTIWSLVLLSIGIAAVAGVKRSYGYMTVFGWWGIVVLVGAGWAAVMG